MLTKEQNDLLTQTGPGTPCGDFLRSYWQPVATAEEMPMGGDPLPIRILSEDLVLFRNEKDRLGLVGRHCPHRGTDLSYRSEEHTSELQSLMRTSYAVFCFKKKNK